MKNRVNEIFLVRTSVVVVLFHKRRNVVLPPFTYTLRSSFLKIFPFTLRSTLFATWFPYMPPRLVFDALKRQHKSLRFLDFTLELSFVTTSRTAAPRPALPRQAVHLDRERHGQFE
jgi:hypothetical protein